MLSAEHHVPPEDRSLRHRPCRPCRPSAHQRHSRSHPATSSQFRHHHHMTSRSLGRQPILQRKKSSFRSLYRFIRGQPSRLATHGMTLPRQPSSCTHHSSTHPRAPRHKRPHTNSTTGSAKRAGRISYGSGNWTTSRAAHWPSAATTATRAASSATRRSTRCTCCR